MKAVQEPSIRQVEMGFEAMNRHNHPVYGAPVSTVYCRFCVSNGGFLGERYNLFRKAGKLRKHNLAYPLHPIVI